jgi:uncharacterized protein YydD (DUF2326 family)
MHTSVMDYVDSLIDTYQQKHRGEKPLYVVLSPEDNERLIEEIRMKNRYPDEQIVTRYRDVSIVNNRSVESRRGYASHELPELSS